MAVAGQDYALIASDTRLTDGGYGILSRTTPKLFQVGTSFLKAEIKGDSILLCQGATLLHTSRQVATSFVSILSSFHRYITLLQR